MTYIPSFKYLQSHNLLHQTINTFGEVREAVGLGGVVGIFDGVESADLISPATTP